MDRLTPALQHWQAQGGMVALGGHRLFVAQAGQHGSVLLLIHGYPTSSYDWHPLWAPLATRHRLIAPDLLGMGFSDKPADHAYGIENHADLLEALLDRLGVQQVHIVAHDLGVSVAQEMLARRQTHPLAPRIQSLTLLNGGVCPEAYQPRMLHTKALLIDDDTCLVGSANFDHRSFRLNFELSVLLHDDAIAARLEAQMTEDLGHCREVRPDRPADGFGRRLAEASARLFSPLL